MVLEDYSLLYILNFSAKIDWLCHGDPNDHHMVMPCAPDKVPDYSHEEHDSFRAFRSQNMNLSISLETSSKKSSNKDHPSCLFYASSFRFLDKIKVCCYRIFKILTDIGQADCKLRSSRELDNKIYLSVHTVFWNPYHESFGDWVHTQKENH